MLISGVLLGRQSASFRSKTTGNPRKDDMLVLQPGYKYGGKHTADFTLQGARIFIERWVLCVDLLYDL